jgi:amino acid permease
MKVFKNFEDLWPSLEPFSDAEKDELQRDALRDLRYKATLFALFPLAVAASLAIAFTPSTICTVCEPGWLRGVIVGTGRLLAILLMVWLIWRVAYDAYVRAMLRLIERRRVLGGA